MSMRQPQILVLALVVMALAAPAGAQEPEQVMTAGFDVAAGGTLEVSVHDADVTLTAGPEGRVDVVVYLAARDMERGRERYERMRFRARLHGNTVSVESDQVREPWSWRDRGYFNVRVEVRLPARFDVDVRTRDGDVVADRLEGDVSLVSEDGDIDAGRLTGQIRIRTADGDILVDEAHGGSVDIRTSDGDLRLGTITATSLELHTSDGDIRADVADADSVNAATSDGSIVLRGIRGSLTAVTHDGDIDVDADRAAEISLQTGDGDVFLSVPGDAALDLDIRGEDLDFGGGSAFSGSIRDDRVEGSLNGGGPTVRIRSGDGHVSLRLRASH